MSNQIEYIVEVFQSRGHEKYGEEAVTQLQHALQSASLAEQSEEDESLIISALLHDIGHLLSDDQLPESLSEDLHDHHEERAFHWIKEQFGEKIADPIRLHVEAKRYLCTIDPDYTKKLSPTSLKSFHDQGGLMNEAEKADFEKETYFKEAVKLRRWDDVAKDPDIITRSLESFLPLLSKHLKN